MKQLSLILFLLIVICSCGNRNACVCSDGQCDTLVIISTNDVHSQIHDMPKLAAYVQSQRDSFSHVLLLSAGDMFSGSPVVDKYKERGYPMIDLMNRIGYRAATLGNHEFDYGQEVLIQRIKDAQFDFLAANAAFTNDLRNLVKPYIIVDVNGIKTAILGFIETEDAGIPSTLPENVEGVKFADALSLVDAYRSLRDSAEVFLVLSHLGVREDISLAVLLPEADLIIGGHSHTSLPQGLDTCGVLIAQTGAYLQNIGKTTLFLKAGKVVKKKSELIALDSLTAVDSAIQRLVDVYENDPALKVTVGTAAADITGKEALGNLFTDAMRIVHKFDIAIFNSGGLRINAYPKGNISFEDVYKLDPFENQLYVYQLTLGELSALLINTYNDKKSDMLRISGAECTLALDPVNADKALSITVTGYNGQPLLPKAAYQVGMSSYVKERFMPLINPKDEGRRIKVTTAETLLQYLQLGPVSPQPQRVFFSNE
ncbi:MAG: bifunctional metallophosphatase/5'-nucleotidase [Bacteroidales bacterium]|nr:bifunctional metallophosphatase/5'-nucleotidase [Bacteroidales bacterium]MCL2133327.1 bifunctional metallophosphatase/5'-nucleotidase [Bacteroidales bacterium]